MTSAPKTEANMKLVIVASSGSHLATTAGYTRKSGTGLWFAGADGFLDPELGAYCRGSPTT